MSFVRIAAAISLCGLVGVAACSSGQETSTDTANNPEGISSESAGMLSGEDAEYASDIDEGEALNAALDANPNDPKVLAWQERFNERADVRAGLFLTIDVEDGHSVKFYEADGTRMIAEWKMNDQEPLLAGKGHSGSFAEAYRVVRPNGEIPRAVLDADRRSEEFDPMLVEQSTESLGMKPVGRAAEPPSASDGSRLVEKHATTCEHFEDGHGFCPNGDQDWCVCNPPMSGNWGPSGYTNTTNSFHAVGPTVGNILLTLQGGSTTHGPFSVSQGNTFSIRMTSKQDCGCPSWPWACGTPDFCKVTHTAEVHNASTDTYFWGACFDGGQPPFDC